MTGVSGPGGSRGGAVAPAESAGPATARVAGAPDAGAVASGRRGAAAAIPLAVLLGMCALSFAYVRDGWRSPGSTLIGIPGDAEMMTWALAWTPHALAHASNPLYTTNLNAPVGVNLTWSTAMPLAGLVLWPVTALWGPITAYDLMLTLGLALSGWCMTLALRRLVPSTLGALAGGLIYGFSPYVIPHTVGHLNLVFAPIPPLILIVLHELLAVRRRSPRLLGALLGLLLGAQFLIAEEMAATEILIAAIAVAVLAAMHPGPVRELARPALRAGAVAAAIFAVMSAGPVLEQFRGPQRIHGLVQAPGVYVSDLLSFVVPTDTVALTGDHAIAIFRNWTGNGSEDGSYLGVALLLLLGVTVVWRRRSPLVRFAAVMAAVSALLSMGPRLHVDGRVTRIPLPAAVFDHLPVLANLEPSRLSLYTWLFTAILVACFVAAVVRERRRIVVPALGVPLLAASVAMIVPRFEVPVTAVDTPAWFTAPGATGPPDATVLVLPFVRQAVPDEPMIWQARSGMRFRMPEGYYQGPGPDGHRIYGVAPTVSSSVFEAIEGGTPPPAVTADLRIDMGADLVRWQITAVAVGPMPHRDAMASFLTELLGRPPTSTGGVLLWSGVDPVGVAAQAEP